MKQTTIIAIALGVLLLISLVQASQLIVMKTKISHDGISTGENSPRTTSANSGSGKSSKTVLPSSIQNLPNMVGGC